MLKLLVALYLAGAVSAGIFSPKSPVKMLDPKTFKQVMKKNETSLVAFVAPWCGHCQRMGPEYEKAAKGLSPLIPAYAVDCDSEANKRLCSEQGVQGFPTVKLFPRGNSVPPMTYEGERTASSIFAYATRRVPNGPIKLSNADETSNWVTKTANSNKYKSPRALLVTKDSKVPLLWKILSNKYAGQISFAVQLEKKGKKSEKGEKKQSSVMFYPVGGESPAPYSGLTKLDNLSKFIDSIIGDPNVLAALIEEQNPVPETATEEAQNTADEPVPVNTPEADAEKVDLSPPPAACDAPGEKEDYECKMEDPLTAPVDDTVPVGEAAPVDEAEAPFVEEPPVPVVEKTVAPTAKETSVDGTRPVDEL